MHTLTLATPVLDVEVRCLGPDDGPAVILLHGWPDSHLTWSRLAPALAEQGHRVFVPSLRGFAGTRFRDADTPRSGQLSALAQDLLDVADALGLRRFDVVGHDWGARAAYIASALWPERIGRCVALSVAWGTNRPEQALAYGQAHHYWYHWLMHLPRGQHAVREDRRGFTRYLWQAWSPGWRFGDDEFEATAAAFDNPDWADVVLHSYTHRWGAAPSDPRYDALEARLREPPPITVPTLHIHGRDDGANGVATTVGRESLFTGGFRLELLEACGHFPQREHPEQVVSMVGGFLRR